jgi:hypothetical protein
MVPLGKKASPLLGGAKQDAPPQMGGPQMNYDDMTRGARAGGQQMALPSPGQPQQQMAMLPGSISPGMRITMPMSPMMPTSSPTDTAWFGGQVAASTAIQNVYSSENIEMADSLPPELQREGIFRQPR